MTAPRSEPELVETIRYADGPLRIRGGGTRPIGNRVGGDPLDVSAISGISLYDPGALTMVAKAGTPLAEIEATLAAEGQQLAFEPMDHRPLLGTAGNPTIGGAVAGNVSGPRRVRVGACVDFMLGVRFVDGRGDVVKNGGRAMKNVTGYDLVKLTTGAWGTLGVLTEAAFKVLPKPETAASLTLHGLTTARAVAAMSRALGSPYEVNGAAHVPNGTDGVPVTFIRVEGFEDSVAYRLEQLRDTLADFGEMADISNPDEVVRQWRSIGTVESFCDDGNDIWRISTIPSKAPDIISRMPNGTSVALDWGGGLIWASCTPGFDLRAHLAPFTGHATLIRASDETRRKLKVFHPEPAPLAQIAAGLRAQFDPRGILNPGLMG